MRPSPASPKNGVVVMTGSVFGPSRSARPRTVRTFAAEGSGDAVHLRRRHLVFGLSVLKGHVNRGSSVGFSRRCYSSTILCRAFSRTSPNRQKSHRLQQSLKNARVESQKYSVPWNHRPLRSSCSVYQDRRHRSTCLPNVCLLRQRV